MVTAGRSMVKVSHCVDLTLTVPESFWTLLSEEFKPHGDVKDKTSGRKKRGGRHGIGRYGTSSDESSSSSSSSIGAMIRADKSDYSTVIGCDLGEKLWAAAAQRVRWCRAVLLTCRVRATC